jgi:beta-glucosidase
MSYTNFDYINLKITPAKQNSQGNIQISFDIKNTGEREGDEVPQLYINEKVTDVTTYEKQLRGFERVHLSAGETKSVRFTLTPDDLSIWNRDMHFVVEPGTFKVMVGASSEDIKLNGEFEILQLSQ